MSASYGRSTTHDGWPTLLSSPRPTGNFRCALTTVVSTRHAAMILSLFHEQIKSWILPLVVIYYASQMLILVFIKYLCLEKMKNIPHV
jgi:hypothetical protein